MCITHCISEYNSLGHVGKCNCKKSRSCCTTGNFCVLQNFLQVFSPSFCPFNSFLSDQHKHNVRLYTDSSMVKQTMRLLSPSSFCFSSLSRPWKGIELFILQVKASPASNGVSSGRRSACQCLYPDEERKKSRHIRTKGENSLFGFLGVILHKAKAKCEVKAAIIDHLDLCYLSLC